MIRRRGNGASAPPPATSRRWRPARSGLLNLYKLDNEEFWWEDGRLLLRGNNGTGKSRVLALQLPFLLDGDVSPHRLEPDADPAKRVEWNPLMGRPKDRVGYTWLEFGRVLDDETAGGNGERATRAERCFASRSSRGSSTRSGSREP